MLLSWRAWTKSQLHSAKLIRRARAAGEVDDELQPPPHDEVDTPDAIHLRAVAEGSAERMDGRAVECRAIVHSRLQSQRQRVIEVVKVVVNPQHAKTPSIRCQQRRVAVGVEAQERWPLDNERRVIPP